MTLYLCSVCFQTVVHTYRTVSVDTDSPHTTNIT